MLFEMHKKAIKTVKCRLGSPFGMRKRVSGSRPPVKRACIKGNLSKNLFCGRGLFSLARLFSAYLFTFGDQGVDRLDFPCDDIHLTPYEKERQCEKQENNDPRDFYKFHWYIVSRRGWRAVKRLPLETFVLLIYVSGEESVKIKRNRAI
jgi:hypothetical protein